MNQKLSAQEQFQTLQRMKVEHEKFQASANKTPKQNEGMSQSQIKFAELSIELEEIHKSLRQECKFVRHIKKLA